MMKYILSLFLTVLIAAGAFFGYQYYELQAVDKAERETLAELNKVNYGLFNLQLWKEKAFTVFEGKMTDFDVDPAVYEEVKAELHDYLKHIYQEYLASGKMVNQFIDQAQAEGKINQVFANMIKQNLGPAIANLGIDKQLPAMAEELTLELKKREPELKGYLTQGFQGILNEEIKTVYNDPRETIYQYYDLESLAETNTFLKQSIRDRTPEINRLKWWSYGLLLGAAIISILWFIVSSGALSIVFLTVSSIVLLILGVTSPMINIDARMNAFTMYVLDQQIGFDEQYLYYQSKSILEVTRTMIEQGGTDLKIVGVLVLCFSILIPLIKLITTGLTLFSRRLSQSSFIKGMIFHLGKWSMADVFVVALFMAYIGFEGILANQLEAIERNDTGFAVETINYSGLAPGALFFTTYCILSILSGVLIQRYLEGSEH